MYGNYTTASNNSRDDPECATYPKSGGRTGGSTLFNKKWGHRLNGKCKPIPMTWDEDDDELEETPQAANGLEEFMNILAEKQREKAESEGEKSQQSWYDDSHRDPIGEISYEQHSSQHSGSYFEQRHKYMDNTYPTTRPMNGEACHPFSAYAVPQKEEIEATPIKPQWHPLAKTEVKKDKENWLDGLLSKTPLPERFHAGNNSNVFGDSGISMTSTKPSLTEGDQKSDLKTSSRSLFTPSLSRNLQINVHDLLGNGLHTQKKSSGNIKKTYMDGMHGLSTPLCNRLTERKQQNEETPMKYVPVEKTEPQDMFKIQMSEIKPGTNKAHAPSGFSEENKENFLFNMPFVSSTTDLHQQNEEGERKLSRSYSHASVLRVDNENTITPSKDDRSLSNISSAKSLSNLFHPGISQGVHASRIPTPIRLHTPHKQQPPSSTSTAGTHPKTSEVDTPMKYSYSPDKKELASVMQVPSKTTVVVDAKQNESTLQFGSAPVIHSILGSNQCFTSQISKAAGQSSLLSSLGSGWSLGLSSKSYADVDSFHGLASQSTGVSRAHSNLESKFASDSQQSGLANVTHQHIKVPADDKSLNSYANPNVVDTLASRVKDDQVGVSHNTGANDSSAPTSLSQPIFHPPSSQAPSLTRKPFSIRPPVFQATLIKSESCHDTQSAHACISSSSPQENSVHGKPSCSNTIESNLQTAQAEISGSSLHSQTSAFKVPSFQVSTSNLNSVCSDSANQQVERNQYHQNAPQVKISHQPAHGLFTTTQTGHDSLNLPQGHKIAPLVSNLSQPFRNSVIPNHANIQATHPSSSCLAGQEFAAPAAVKAQLPEKDTSTAAVVRPISVQPNRKILVVNKRSYEVLRLLGKGASSKVYDVLDCQTHRCVAVKRVVLRQGDALVEGYLKEVELLNQLQGSECIIKLIDSEVCLERGFKVLYMVMERGEMDLSTSIKLMSASKAPLIPGSAPPGSRIPIVTVIYYWVSMLNAVDEIHRKGIVHSDLKPANFLLVGGQLKLIDFGIATAVQTDVTSVVKDDPAGTPNYMSPEAIGLTVCGSPNTEDTFKNPKASYKSDVWSLGCILYSLIYGRSPFQHITNERIKLDAIRNPNYAIPFSANYSVHPPLLRALKRCLVRDYKQRASIAELKAIDYLCSSDVDEEAWDAWKTSLAKNILSVLSHESSMQALKVIQEAFKSLPTRKKES